MNQHQKLQLVIVVNGVETLVEGNVQAPMRVVAQHALNASGNSGRPLSEWELKDEQGRTLDLERRLGDFGFAPSAVLYLTLAVGVNGSMERAHSLSQPVVRWLHHYIMQRRAQHPC